MAHRSQAGEGERVLFRSVGVDGFFRDLRHDLIGVVHLRDRARDLVCILIKAQRLRQGGRRPEASDAVVRHALELRDDGDVEEGALVRCLFDQCA